MEKVIIEEIRKEYGSVSRMINYVRNKAEYLRKYCGREGQDGGKTLEEALQNIPQKWRPIYYKYCFSTYKP